MPARRASGELLAPPGDVWTFLAEPRHLADWWPNVGSVEPDRRGVAVGARWLVRMRGATWLRRAASEDTLLVQAAEPERRFAFELVRTRLRVELRLADTGTGRTRADLTASWPFRAALPRTLPSVALDRLQALVQTAAEL